MPKCLQIGKVPNELLSVLLKKLPCHDKDIVIPPGIGLDAAALRIGDRTIALSTDPITFATKEIAKYSLRVNVNDIACMGCKPRWYTGVLLLPEGTLEKELHDLWTVMVDELNEYGISSIGGHTEVTSTVNVPVLIGQIIGEPAHDHLYDPRDTQPGDKLLLWRGASVEGTALLANERYDALSKYILPAQLDTMINLIDDPGICIYRDAEKLFGMDGLVAMHDPTEGGVATAMHEIADAAGCGLKIDGAAIPILSETLQLADVLKFNPLGLLASGSLLIVCKPEVEKNIKAILTGGRIECVGEFTKNVKQRDLNYIDRSIELPRFDQDEVVNALSVEIYVAFLGPSHKKRQV